MAYDSLAEDLIAAQRDLLGDGATDVARGVDGLVITDDGSVEAIHGDPVAVVGDLAAAYEDALGAVARATTQSVADDYRDELELPRTLA